jgi:hypothetical protein
MTTSALGLSQHLQTPNTLIFLLRVLGHIQITTAPAANPQRSLMAFWALLSAMNAISGLFHCLDYWSGGWGGKGLLLDFVGESE